MLAGGAGAGLQEQYLEARGLGGESFTEYDSLAVHTPDSEETAVVAVDVKDNASLLQLHSLPAPDVQAIDYSSRSKLGINVREAE